MAALLADANRAGADGPVLDALADVLSGKVGPEKGFRVGPWRLGRVSGSKMWYGIRYNASIQDNDRKPLRTRDFKEAAVRLVARYVSEGRVALGQMHDPTVALVVQLYLNDPKRAASWEGTSPSLLRTLGTALPGVTVSGFTANAQKRLIVALRASRAPKPLEPGTVANCMMLAGAAIRAACQPDGDGHQLCTRLPPRVTSSIEAVCEVLDLPVPEARNWHCTMDQMAAFLRHIADNEPLRRWCLLALCFACRAGAAVKATRSQIDRELCRGLVLYRLNPKNRRQQRSKYRPTLPIPEAALAEFESWPEEVWVGRSLRRLRYAFERAALDLGLGPDHIPSSVRDFMATYLRRAYVDYGVPFVPDQQIEMWMGHRRKGINHLYGQFSPEYLLLANLAVEAILLDLDRRSGGVLFRHPRAAAVAAAFPGKLRQARALLRGEAVAHVPWGDHSSTSSFQGGDDGETAQCAGENGSKRVISGPSPTSFRQARKLAYCTLDGLWDILHAEATAGSAQR
jgi:hypothetical protein